MSVYIYGDSNSSIAALVGNDEEEDRDGINNKDVYGQKKRKRWKTLLDGLILRRRRKSTISRQALKEGQDSTHREDTHHVFMVMDSLYQAEHRMLKYGRNTVRDTQASANAAHVDDGDGSGVECLHFADQQPTKKMKLGRAYSSDVPFAISEDDAESTTSGVKSLGSCSTPGMANGTLRVMPSDLESVLSLWSVLHRVDMVALFQDIGEEEIELILVDEDIRDMVVEKPWAFTPEERSKILEACADLNDPSDDASDTCSVLSWSGVSSLSSNSACHIPIALAFTCRSRGAAARAVNPWAAAKRGDMKALQAIAATHNPSIWMTEDAFGATPLYYACRSSDRRGGPEVVLFLLEQWPTGCVPSLILENCRKNAVAHDVVRILSGDEKFIAEVRSRTIVSDDESSYDGLPLLYGEAEI